MIIIDIIKNSGGGMVDLLIMCLYLLVDFMLDVVDVLIGICSVVVLIVGVSNSVLMFVIILFEIVIGIW